MLTTGDKLLNIVREKGYDITELARFSDVPVRTIIDIMAGVKEPELGVMCKIADVMSIPVQDFCSDEDTEYGIAISKDTLAKLIVISEINGVQLDKLVESILEKGIEEHGFYE
jgi:transcriptional regulator with XRE-family HTH domain